MKNAKNKIVLSTVLLCALLGIAYQNCGQIDPDIADETQNTPETLNLLSKEEVPVKETSDSAKAIPAPAPTLPVKPCPKDPKPTDKCYSVSGKLYSLNGGTVVLANNGVNLLPLTANGPFTFTQLLMTGSPYNVTVNTQPIGQTCTVYTGAGVIAYANITNVVVKCVAAASSCTNQSNKTWTFPTNSSQANSLQGYQAGSAKPNLAFNNADQAIVLYPEVNPNPNSQLPFRSERSSMGIWNNPTNINQYFGPWSVDIYNTDFDVAMNSNGNAISAWVARTIAPNPNPDQHYLYFAEKIAGNWSSPNVNSNINFNNIHGSDSDLVSVEMADNGDAVIVWSEDTVPSTRSNVYLAHKHNGAWTFPASVNDHINLSGQFTTSVGVPKVGMSANGSFIVITWEQHTTATNKWQTFMSWFDGNIWHHPTSLSNFIGPTSAIATRNVEVSVSKNGQHAAIVWIGDNNYIFASTYDNGVWVHPASLTNYINQPGWSYPPNVKVNDNGYIIVAWDQISLGLPQWHSIYKSERINGTWVTPISLADRLNANLFLMGNFNKPEISLNNYGKALLTWSDPNHYFKAEKASSTAAWVLPGANNYFDFNVLSAYPRRLESAVNENCNAMMTWTGDNMIYTAIYQ